MERHIDITTRISLDQFLEYETIRQSGICNMYDLRTIMELSSLEKDDIKLIMSNYDVLAKEYGTDIDDSRIEDIKEQF
jgi:flagellar assembly factor FliW